jgi:hypothetical protein
MSVITISFKGRSGSGKDPMARLVKEQLVALGFACGPINRNEAHQRESFVVQDPKKTLQEIGK